MGLILSILLNLALLAVGLLLAAAGLRGRRVGDHRFCRKCGFDLTGRPAGGRRCAECGANLTRAAGVAVGRRCAAGVEPPALDTTPAAWVARLGGGWEGTPRTVVLEGEAAHTAAVGAVEVEAAVPYWIGEFTGGTIPSTRPAVVLASGTVRQARTVRIVARDDLDGVVVIDPAAAGAMARAVGARWVEWSERAGRVVVAIDVNTPALPYPLKHAVFLRAGGEEVRVGELVATPGGSSMQDRDPKLDQGKLPAAVVRTGRVDVVLRPDTEAIVRDPHGPPPWGGEIVLKDVPVNPAVR